MAEKPDSGDIVAQTAVPILPDDTAREVFDKVTVAAEMTLDAVLPALLNGTAPRRPQDLRAGSYFGGRGPDDGIIDWNKDAAAIHNLARAVAPPFPGAFTSVGGHRARVLRTRVVDGTAAPTLAPSLSLHDGAMIAHCGGGGRLALLALEIDDEPVDAAQFAQRFGATPVALGDAPAR
jgi:methionyl-tRNA formyltransferase